MSNEVMRWIDGELIDFNEPSAKARLDAAIEAFAGDTGPVSWNVSDINYHSAVLVGRYLSIDEEDVGSLTDRAWTDYGGDKIMSAAGCAVVVDRAVNEHHGVIYNIGTVMIDWIYDPQHA